MDDYIKFKKLLAWFVNQLNINNGVTDGEKLTGHGYNMNSSLRKEFNEDGINTSLRKYYNDYRSYSGFELDCCIDCAFDDGDYAYPVTNYIILADADFKVIPVFDEASNEVISLYLGNHAYWGGIERNSEPVSVTSLGLNDAEPNQALRDFFNMFKQKMLEYERNLDTDVVDEKVQRAAFIQWYVDNGGSKNSANTISSAIGTAWLKDGRAVFSIADFYELNNIINAKGLDGYFESRDGDYSKMDLIFDFKSNTKKSDLKNGIKFYLRFLKHNTELSAEHSNDEKRFWLCSTGDNGHLWNEFYSLGIVGIGYNKFDVGDLRFYISEEALKDKVTKLSAENKFHVNTIHAMWQFANDMAIGDIVYAKQGLSKILGKGVVEGDYTFNDERTDYKHIRKINWLDNYYIA